MLASALEVSANRKLGPVLATFVSQVSCPEECPWYDDGKLGSPCYANNGYLGFITAKLNKGQGDHLDAAREEAELIRGLSGEHALRLHVVGDCKEKLAAEMVSSAADEYRARRGQLVWTYTRAWQNIPRKSWGGVSVLASCETPAQVRRAESMGYATAIVVSEFEDWRAYNHRGIKVVPCPQETGHAPTCAACKLCWRDDILRKASITIGFEAHSGGAKKVRQRLLQIEARVRTAGSDSVFLQ